MCYDLIDGGSAGADAVESVGYWAVLDSPLAHGYAEALRGDWQACEAAEARAAAKEAEAAELAAHAEWLQGQLTEAAGSEPARQARRYEAELARLREEASARAAALEARAAQEAAARADVEEELTAWRARGAEGEGAARAEAEAAALRARLAGEESRCAELAQASPLFSSPKPAISLH